MCCPLRTHTKVIAILSLIASGLGALRLITTVTGFLAGTRAGITVDGNLLYGGHMGVALAVQILVFVFCIVSDVLCLVGAIKNNKCLLVPYIVKMSLILLGLAIVVIMCIYWGSIAGALISSVNNDDFRHVSGSIAAIYFFLFLIPLFIMIGLASYFLAIVVKFFQELASGVIEGQSEGMVLQPHSSQPGVATVYVPQGSEYHQQPPAYNPGMKHPV